MGEAISDALLARTLRRYAALAALALDDPEAWLGWGNSEPDDDGVEPSLLARAGERLSDRIRGRVHPASPGWSGLPVEQRSKWWVEQVGTVAAFAAATPRFFGALADRVPVQAAFGAAAQGIAVCAVAREHGVTESAAWVPLLATVLFDRDLAATQGSGQAADDVDDADGVDDVEDVEVSRDGEPDEPESRGRLRRAAALVWRLARTLLAVQGLFDERPRGRLRYRLLGKVPVVGVLGGFLDERDGVRKAAEQTVRLLADERLTR